MNLRYKQNKLIFILHTKDNKEFQCYLDYKVKRNWAWIKHQLFSNDTFFIDDLIMNCCREWFKIWVNQSWMFENENVIHGVIDTYKLKLVNSHINTFFRSDFMPKGWQIEDIEIKYLIL